MSSKKLAKSVAVIAAVGAMMMSSMNVLAEGITYTPVAGEKVNVPKYLVMDKSANTPAVEFSFAIDGGDEIVADPDSNTMAVYSGTDADRVVGTPDVGTAVFEADQETFDEAQAYPTGTNLQVADGKTDTVNLASDDVYAVSTFEIDFSSVTFNEPGVYRYEITEVENADLAASGITFDTVTRILDVYVLDNAGDLEVSGYVLHENADVLENSTDANSVTKSNGFINSYKTEELTIAVKVEGNQASRDEYFETVFKVTDAIPGTVYNVDISNADATTIVTGNNSGTYTNPTSITIDADGNCEVSFWLQNGQSVTIRGLAENTNYTVNEDKDYLDKAQYSVGCAGTGDDTNGTFTAGTLTYGDSITGTTTVTFTNAKSGIIPTGVILAVAPAVVIAIIGVAGITAIALKKRKNVE